MHRYAKRFWGSERGSVAFEAVWIGLFLTFLLAPLTFLYSHSQTNLDAAFDLRSSARNYAQNEFCAPSGFNLLPFHYAEEQHAHRLTNCTKGLNGESAMRPQDRFWRKMKSVSDQDFPGLTNGHWEKGQIEFIRSETYVAMTRSLELGDDNPSAVFNQILAAADGKRALVPLADYWKGTEEHWADGHDEVICDRLSNKSLRLFPKVFPAASTCSSPNSSSSPPPAPTNTPDVEVLASLEDGAGVDAGNIAGFGGVARRSAEATTLFSSPTPSVQSLASRQVAGLNAPQPPTSPSASTKSLQSGEYTWELFQDVPTTQPGSGGAPSPLGENVATKSVQTAIDTVPTLQGNDAPSWQLFSQTANSTPSTTDTFRVGTLNPRTEEASETLSAVSPDTIANGNAFISELLGGREPSWGTRLQVSVLGATAAGEAQQPEALAAKEPSFLSSALSTVIGNPAVRALAGMPSTLMPAPYAASTAASIMVEAAEAGPLRDGWWGKAQASLGWVQDQFTSEPGDPKYLWEVLRQVETGEGVSAGKELWNRFVSASFAARDNLIAAVKEAGERGGDQLRKATDPNASYWEKKRAELGYLLTIAAVTLEGSVGSGIAFIAEFFEPEVDLLINRPSAYVLQEIYNSLSEEQQANVTQAINAVATFVDETPEAWALVKIAENLPYVMASRAITKVKKPKSDSPDNAEAVRLSRTNDGAAEALSKSDDVLPSSSADDVATVGTNRISTWEGVDTTSRGIGADVPDNIAGWVKGPDGSSIPIQKTASGQPDWKRFLQDNAEVTNISGNVDSSSVRFTQSSISSNFSDGSSVDDLVIGLRNGTVDPSSVPPVRTFEVNGQLYSLDNRRLYAYQQAGIDVPTKPATTAEIKQETYKFTTPNGGQNIVVRGQ